MHNKQSLDALGQLASNGFLLNGTPLNDGVTKIARQHALTDEQVSTVCRRANHHVNAAQMTKEAYTEFPVARPEAVLAGLGSDKTASLAVYGIADFDGAGLDKTASSEAFEPVLPGDFSELASLYGQTLVFTGDRAQDGERFVKAAEVVATRALDSQRIHKCAADDAAADYYNQVRRSLLEGVSINDIKGEAKRTNTHHLLAKIYRRLEAEGLVQTSIRDDAGPYSLERMYKVAHGAPLAELTRAEAEKINAARRAAGQPEMTRPSAAEAEAHWKARAAMLQTRTYDKAKWHLDAGGDPGHMHHALDFFAREKLLNDSGREIGRTSMHEGVGPSLKTNPDLAFTRDMFTPEGQKLMDGHYDSWLHGYQNADLDTAETDNIEHFEHALHGIRSAGAHKEDTRPNHHAKGETEPERYIRTRTRNTAILGGVLGAFGGLGIGALPGAVGGHYLGKHLAKQDMLRRGHRREEFGKYAAAYGITEEVYEQIVKEAAKEGIDPEEYIRKKTRNSTIVGGLIGAFGAGVGAVPGAVGGHYLGKHIAKKDMLRQGHTRETFGKYASVEEARQADIQEALDKAALFGMGGPKAPASPYALKPTMGQKILGGIAKAPAALGKMTESSGMKPTPGSNWGKTAEVDPGIAAMQALLFGKVTMNDDAPMLKAARAFDAAYERFRIDTKAVQLCLAGLAHVEKLAQFEATPRVKGFANAAVERLTDRAQRLGKL